MVWCVSSQLITPQHFIAVNILWPQANPLLVRNSHLKLQCWALTMTAPTFATAATHPAYKVVGPACEANPKQAAALWLAYCDLAYAANWSDLSPLQSSSSWALLSGVPPPPLISAGPAQTVAASTKPTVVFPVDLETTLAPADLKEVFASLPPAIGSDTILLAAASNDGTVVYYKLSRGLVKPVN